MGQEAGDEPRIFLPGTVSTGADEGCSLLFPGGRSFLWRTFGRDHSSLLLIGDRGGRWQPPREVRFLDEPSDVWDFTISPDGRFIYFTSDQPLAGSTRPNLWRIPVDGGRFGEAQPLNTEVDPAVGESYPSVTRDGMVYFFRWSPKAPKQAFIHRAKLDGGSFASSEALPASASSGHLDHDPFIAPDGSYLIFASHRPGGLGKGDLYITFALPDGGWSDVVPLKRGINSAADDNRPSVTPDGRYFFFSSTREVDVHLPPGGPAARSKPGDGDRNIFWMKAGFIEELREQSTAAR